MSASGGKWIEGLHAATPSAVGAARAVSERMAAVAELLDAAARKGALEPKAIHRLRVGTRRAAAAVRMFADMLPHRARRATQRCLRRLRRAAGDARALDVHRALIERDRDAAPAGVRPAFDWLLEQMAAQREAAQRQVERAAERIPPKRIERLERRLVTRVRYPLTQELRSVQPGLRAGDAATEPASEPPPLFMRDLARAALPPLIEQLRAAAEADLLVYENVHELRIAGKKLRYALELLDGCVAGDIRGEVYPEIEAFQERLGAINDAHELHLRAADARPPDDAGLRAALAAADGPAELYARRRRQLHQDFLDWWSDVGHQGFLGKAERLIRAGGARGNGAPPEPLGGLAARMAPAHRRVAAIDVGTNSLRMVIAETDPQERFRVVEDVKETTRLGSGLYASGKLGAGAVKRSVQALGRMRAIAEQHGVERLRAVATSAAREARNGPEFVELVHRRTGIALEIIDAEQEARFAFSSVANAFPLDDALAVIVDIGGGSTEVVFSRRGTIDSVFKLPVGAVRLTETYADSGDVSGVRFDELQGAIDRLIAGAVRRARFQPELMIGSGGTFTNLARLAIRRGLAGHGAGRFPFDIRGVEVDRAAVIELLDWLRTMSLEERRRVPGLSAQRAEIIIAGFAVIERLLTHLNIDRVRVHDGGIRDGLLLEMVDDLGYGSEAPVERERQALHEVRQLAEACDYEVQHSEHVAWLALRIFDQLARQTIDARGSWARPRHRELLEAAAILHDAGVLHGFPRHHKRSYEIIMHARLPAFTHREVELIANIARYHRKRPPDPRQPRFSRLSSDDQRLVQRLAGILRVADGLDRLHVQNVRAVAVEVAPPTLRIVAIADEAPRTNLRFAERKADLLAQAFHLEPRFDWTTARSDAERGVESR